MEKFWPSLPYVVPNSQGIPLWWDIFWWSFQVVIMTVILVLLRNWAAREDKAMDEEAEQPSTFTSGTDIKM